MRRLTVFDTTLRDGDQAAGIAFDRETKRSLAISLANFGVDIIEAGFPLSSQHDFNACCDIISVLRDFPVKVAVLCGANISDISNVSAILNANSVLHITLPVSDLHIESFFGVSRANLIKKAKSIISYAAGLVASIEIGAEDASRADVDFLYEYCDAVIESGAKVVNIADTVGLFVPYQIELLIESLRKCVDGFKNNKAGLSIHCHNDYGLAVANTLAAIKSGCTQIEVTVGGIGERAGNAALEEVIANVILHPEIYGVSTNLKTSQLRALTNQFYSAAGIVAGRMKPLVGWNIRAHASGIHQKGIEASEKNYSPDFSYDKSESELESESESESELSEKYSIYNSVPERIVLSRHSGKAGIRLFAKQIGLEQIDDNKVEQLLKRIKNSELRFIGITEFIKLARELQTTPEMNSIYPISCKSYAEFYNDKKYEVSIELSDGEIIYGEGVDSANALLSAVLKISNLEIKINKIELTGINGSYRLYAELFVTNNQTNNRNNNSPDKMITAIERLGTQPNRLLFECILDIINRDKILQLSLQKF
jgi:2-isopropylmalate synthase